MLVVRILVAPLIPVKCAPLSYTIESIRQDGEIITDGDRIASMVTAFFAKRFKRLPEEKERDRKLTDFILGANEVV